MHTQTQRQFIDSVVAAPGEDEPRLIYADWLEERGDLRAHYLRAELEFASAIPQTGPDTDLQAKIFSFNRTNENAAHSDRKSSVVLARELEEKLAEMLPSIASDWLTDVGIRFDLVSLDKHYARNASELAQSDRWPARVVRSGLFVRTSPRLIESIPFFKCHDLKTNYTRGKPIFGIENTADQRLNARFMMVEDMHQDSSVCPICCSQLKTDLAQQCLCCGADWH